MTSTCYKCFKESRPAKCGSPAFGPDGAPLPPDAVTGGRLSLTYRGPLPRLLEWLAAQPLADLRVEPQGLGPIYRRIHGEWVNG